MVTLPAGDWYEDIAYPLYAALDAAGDKRENDGKTNEERWAGILKACPWLTEACRPPVDESIIERVGEPIFDDDDDVPWFPLKSGNLEAYRIMMKWPAGKDGIGKPTTCLEVRFMGGAVYRYGDVPMNVIDGLAAASSPGGYLASHIKGKYPTEKLDGAHD